MAEPDQEPDQAPKSVTCQACHHAVPDLPYCTNCGHQRDVAPSGTSRAYAASPHEPVRALRLFTTLFPHLPHHEIEGFRGALILGALSVLLLIAVGAYPLAFMASAVVVPLLFLLYFFAVDIYEGEPLKVITATLIWGAASGIAAGFVLRSIAFVATGQAGGVPVSIVLRDGVLLPTAQAALVALGPLFLLRYRSFDDVLDGATFGSIAASVFAGMSVVVRSFDLLRSGFLPGGDPYSWLVQVATQGVAYPILFAATVGGVCASFWLRFRAPVRDDADLGPFGRPWLASLAGAVLLSVAGVARVLASPLVGLAVVALCSAVALLWLRFTIHAGLREEAASSGQGSEIRCRECGRLTPGGAFCGHCGIALRALPLAPGTRRGTKAAASVAAQVPAGPGATS